MTEPPCDWHVHEGNETLFCEAGPKGHKGSHIGTRTAFEYARLLANAKQSAIAGELQKSFLTGRKPRL